MPTWQVLLSVGDPLASVSLTVAGKRIRASRPLSVLVTNANGFAVSGALSGQTRRGRGRALRLGPRRFTVLAGRTTRVALSSPAPQARTDGVLTPNPTAQVSDPAGNPRLVTVRPR